MATSIKHPLREPAGYWTASAQPLASLIFVAPILLGYEIGILVLGPEAMRNGADVWLRHFLGAVGLGQYLLLPAATCGLLLAWHHVTRHQWEFRPKVIAGMAAESLAWAGALLLFAQLQSGMFETAFSTLAQEADTSKGLLNLELAISYLGAGLYEELLFRMMLLPVLALLVRSAGASTKTSVTTAVITSSLLFSAAHYDLITPLGEPFMLFSFLFRFMAGLFFALLFIKRGFGIAAGAHALYDLLVMMN